MELITGTPKHDTFCWHIPAGRIQSKSFFFIANVRTAKIKAMWLCLKKKIFPLNFYNTVSRF
jgi:hypothetical protein